LASSAMISGLTLLALLAGLGLLALYLWMARKLSHLTRMIDNTPQGLVMFDSALNLVVTNKIYLDLYKMSPDIVKPGVSLRAILEHRTATGTFHEDIDQYIARVRHHLESGEVMSADFDTPDGRTFCVTNKPMKGGGWVASHQDITERRRAERELDRTRNFLNAIVDNVPEVLVVKSAHDGRYVFINRSGEALYGVPRSELIGRRTSDFFPPEQTKIIGGRDQEALRRGRLDLESHLLAVRGSEKIYVDSSRVAINGKDGKPEYLLTVIKDISERRETQLRIAHLAHHDPLTDLPNRAAFNAKLDETIAAAEVAGARFTLLCMDLDHFKEVNDLFGHAAGDDVLLKIAKRIVDAAGKAFISRLGGDEFMLIATDGEQPEAARDLAGKLIRALSDEIEYDGRKLRIGLSVGAAVYPDDGCDAATLLRNADAALYRAKAEGRGMVRFYEIEMDRALHDRRELQNELSAAIERGELALHYQPQAKINGTVIGFEALLRWDHPQRGFVPPGKFIPLAEEAGLIAGIGEWVLREACREAASWRRPLQIAVNLSPFQFRQGDLVTLVCNVLLETGLAPDRLVLEITESALMNDFSRALSTLRRLKALGVQIAMDDFGTGYSSLSYLQSFPFDKIKIDKTFISNLDRNAQSAAIVRAVMGLGRNLKLLVVAEGVETKEQLEALRREHCDEMQGYLIGYPSPIDDYAQIVGRTATRRQNAVISA
jgi:diguanylate cyclase (GGDEF)-like protein/PAS domain S-box-containing protein